MFQGDLNPGKATNNRTRRKKGLLRKKEKVLTWNPPNLSHLGLLEESIKESLQKESNLKKIPCKGIRSQKGS